MDTVGWGIIGCGDVTEVKSGPGFQLARNSRLVAVMRRNADKAADYARRHTVNRFYDRVETLLSDPEVNAVYIATPPSSHLDLALKAADAGKPCLVEKPMAMSHGECQCMLRAFEEKGLALFVAYYRRALPRFLKAKELIQDGAIGEVTSVHIVQYQPLASLEEVRNWRFNPRIAGGGLFMDLASHGLDLLDFLLGPIRRIRGFSVNTGGAYPTEDVTSASFVFESGMVGTGIWNFNADHSEDCIRFTGSRGELDCPVFSDTEIVLRGPVGKKVFPFHNPPHVHQPLIQSVVDDLLGQGKCASSGESAARTAWAMDRCLGN